MSVWVMAVGIRFVAISRKSVVTDARPTPVVPPLNTLFALAATADAVHTEPGFMTLFGEYNKYLLRRVAVWLDI